MSNEPAPMPADIARLYGELDRLQAIVRNPRTTPVARAVARREIGYVEDALALRHA